MKKFILILAIVFISNLAYADTWCMWDGSQGTNCQSDSKGYIVVQNGFKVHTESILNSHGYFHTTITHPAVGENQLRDQEVWDKVDNEITKTWTVRDMTSEEIDEHIASPMQISEYYIWKALLVKGVITQQDAVDRLPQDLIDAYLARDRLENP